MTQDYYGTKRITAWPQDHETSGDPGYAVKYADGYISWSPQTVFEAAYDPITAMSFGHALRALKEGHQVARAGWNGKGMWLVLIYPYDQKDQFYVTELPNMGGTLIEHPYLKTADSKLVPWLCSLTDMMAADWQIVG